MREKETVEEKCEFLKIALPAWTELHTNSQQTQRHLRKMSPVEISTMRYLGEEWGWKKMHFLKATGPTRLFFSLYSLLVRSQSFIL